ncbi:MAG TPA: PglZ domain-containing protein [Chloroflexota bacterium]|nr:PglZ domain-containing protein [Chloroflexota bacterium]
MSTSLQKHIHATVHGYLERYTGAWLLWCDPRGTWAPLLRRVAGDNRLGGFALLEVEETTVGEPGSPLARRELQERLDAGESLVVLIRAMPSDLGWLWAQALEAEEVYGRSLREQLLDWGWHPTNLALTEQDLALLARQNLARDPAAWGADTVSPDPAALLDVLAGRDIADGDDRLVLDRTIEHLGLQSIGQAGFTLWRKRTLASLLVSQASQAAPGVIAESHQLMVDAAPRDRALVLLDDWLDSISLRKRLAAAIAEADPIADLGPIVVGALTNGNLLDAALHAKAPPIFLSRVAEQAVFSAACKYFSGLEDKPLLTALGNAYPALAQRAAGFWGEPGPGGTVLPWGELTRLALAARDLLDAAPKGDWRNPVQAIEWYAGGGWRVDRAGEELLRTLDTPVPEIVSLLNPIRDAFRNRWEDLAIRWSQVWREAGYPPAGLTTAGEWLKPLLAVNTPTVVMVADALRYDQAAKLVERLNEQEGIARATVTPARAPMPSVTALGMGLALPIAESDLTASLVNGGWQLRQLGHSRNLSQAEERRAWWQAHGHVAPEDFLAIRPVLDGKTPPPVSGHTRLVIYDDALDKLGHDDELEDFGAQAILERYLQAIGRLRDAGWRRVLMTTDHGYIHWAGTAEQDAPAPALHPAYTCRRAMAYPAGALEGRYPLTPGGTYKVAVSAGASTFKTYGGRGYYHGGGSLQEWVIPCLKVEWPATARPVELEIQPLKAILSLRPRIMLEVRMPSLLIEDALPRRIGARIRDSATLEILFRASEEMVTPDAGTVSIRLERTKQTAARGTPVRIEVYEAATEAVIASSDSTLMIPMDAWTDE